MTRRLTLWTLAIGAAVAIGACDASPATDEPDPSPGTRIVCGHLDPVPCARIVNAALDVVDEGAGISLIVAELGKDPDRPDPGPDRWLVTFVPAEATDAQPWPRTFVVMGGPGRGWTVEPWGAGRPLPDHFVELLRASGVADR